MRGCLGKGGGGGRGGGGPFLCHLDVIDLSVNDEDQSQHRFFVNQFLWPKIRNEPVEQEKRREKLKM